MPAQDTKQTTNPGHVLLEWSSPERPFKQRSQEYFKTIAAFVFLISVILFFIKEYVLIVAVLSVAFVAYALASVPPNQTKHRITKLGIETSEHFHRWDEFRDFWFDESHGQELLVMHTYLPYPSRLFLLLGDTPKEKIEEILSKHIPFREKPEHTFLDRASRFITTKLPLEKSTSN